MTFFLLNLREKKPKVYSIQVSDQEIYETIQIEGNLRKFDHSGVASDWHDILNPIVKEIKKKESSKFTHSQETIRGLHGRKERIRSIGI